MRRRRRSPQLRADDRVVVRYVDNPNGSLDDIAGICNAGRNVVGLMPHPERASDPILGSADGVVLLRSLLAAAVPTLRAMAAVERSTRSATPTSRAERLAIVADTFAAPTRALLARSAADARRATCSTSAAGPGTRPRCCATALPASRRSPGSTRRRRWSTEARARCRTRAFAVADVTAAAAAPGRRRLRPPPARSPARSRRAALGDWATALRPGSGSLVCEEPVRYRSDDPCSAATRRPSPRSSPRPARRCGPRRRSTHDPTGLRTRARPRRRASVPAARAAAMFWRNAVQWRTGRARRRRADRAASATPSSRPETRDEPVMWRDCVRSSFRKRPG